MSRHLCATAEQVISGSLESSNYCSAHAHKGLSSERGPTSRGVENKELVDVNTGGRKEKWFLLHGLYNSWKKPSEISPFVQCGSFCLPLFVPTWWTHTLYTLMAVGFYSRIHFILNSHSYLLCLDVRKIMFQIPQTSSCSPSYQILCTFKPSQLVIIPNS